ncbi:unnamed protein product, partial [marine sediment metagenome]
LVEDCDSEGEKPSERKSCECSENWVCDEWSNIEKQCGERKCIDANNCGTEKDKPEIKKSCVTFLERIIESKYWIVGMVGILIIVVVIIIFVRRKRE